MNNSKKNLTELSFFYLDVYFKREYFNFDYLNNV